MARLAWTQALLGAAGQGLMEQLFFLHLRDAFWTHLGSDP